MYSSGDYCHYCMDHCLECSSGNTCDVCAPGYKYVEGNCVGDQVFLDKIAEQMDGCTAPDLSTCGSTCSGEGCNFQVSLTNNEIVSMFDCLSELEP